MDFFLQMNENAFVTRAKNASKQKNVNIAKERKIKQLLYRRTKTSYKRNV